MEKKLLVLGTGGTISSTPSPEGLKPGKRVEELLAGTRLPDGWVAEVRDVGSRLSSSFSLEQLNDLSNLVASTSSDAVVVLHGTGIMEESVFLADVRMAGADNQRPVVFTGAQRIGGEPGSDGLQNLRDAVCLATHPLACRMGAVIVFNGFIWPANFVVKSDSWSLAAYTAGDAGPLGRIYGNDVSVYQWPAWRYPCHGSGLNSRVELIWFSAGMRRSVVDNCIERGVQGIVVAGSGIGNVSEDLGEAIHDALLDGIAVVITTRTGSGPTFGLYGGTGGSLSMANDGALFTSLHPLKARLLLMAALAGQPTALGSVFAGRPWI